MLRNRLATVTKQGWPPIDYINQDLKRLVDISNALGLPRRVGDDQILRLSRIIVWASMREGHYFKQPRRMCITPAPVVREGSIADGRDWANQPTVRQRDSGHTVPADLARVRHHKHALSWHASEATPRSRVRAFRWTIWRPPQCSARYSRTKRRWQCSGVASEHSRAVGFRNSAGSSWLSLSRSRM